MKALRTLAAVALIACFAPAQVTSISGSGCANSGMSCKFGGAPSIGGQVAFKCANFNFPQSAAFLMIGFEINPGVQLNAPLTCGPCSLVAFEVVTVVTQGVVSIAINIPPDPTLVGLCFTVQGGALLPTCLDLAAGWNVCLQ